MGPAIELGSEHDPITGSPKNVCVVGEVRE
jgi:hypothetical protein